VGAYGAGQGAGQGLHDFTYSMYPHGGGWREAGTERAGCLPIASTMRPQDSLK
jgi:alpha-mannosidase